MKRFITLLFLVISTIGLTRTLAQTYERDFWITPPSIDKFSFVPTENGCLITSDEYKCSYGSDASKPALPFIEYKILLPDDCIVYDYNLKMVMGMYLDTEVTLASNPLEASGTGGNANYPLITYPVEAIYDHEEVIDGYRIAHLRINPFTYEADAKELILAQSLKLTISIEEVGEDEKIGHVGTMAETVKGLIYNPDDIDKGLEAWRKYYTVSNFGVEKYDMLDFLYAKDWNVSCTSLEFLKETCHMGITSDSVHNGVTYQVIERTRNGQIADSLLYRQDGGKVYRYSPTKEEDILLFNFDLKEGESFMTTYGEEWIMDEVHKKARYGGRTGKVLVLKGKEDGKVKDIWLEHVGSLHTGILTFADIGQSTKPYLTFCRQADNDMPWLFDVKTENLQTAYFYPNEDVAIIGKVTPEEFEFFEERNRNEYGYALDNLLATFIGDTLCIYGNMSVYRYNYLMECRVDKHEIELKVSHVNGNIPWETPAYEYVRVKFPGIKPDEYLIKYYPWFSDGEHYQVLKSPTHSVEKLQDNNGEFLTVKGSTLHCTAPDAVKLEVYTMDAIKVGEARFVDGKAAVKVGQTPAMYLYIVTYPDGRRESGKARVSEE